jgi:hypothetical protein
LHADEAALAADHHASAPEVSPVVDDLHDSHT